MGTPQIDLTAGLVQKAPAAASAAPTQSPTQGGIDLSAGLVSHADAGTQPYPIADSDKGAISNTVKVGEGMLKLPANIWHAFSSDPQDDEEKNVDANMGRMGLAMHRLIAKPMQKSQDIADAYQKIADDKKAAAVSAAGKPKDESLVKELTLGLIDPAGKPAAGREWDSKKSLPRNLWNFVFSGNADDNGEYEQHMANVHRIAAMTPLLGPSASDVAEHYAQGDKSGAVSQLLTLIAAGKATDSVTKGMAKQIKKVAPTKAVVAGEEAPMMAGQLKNAAPVAQEVATEPSPEIAAQQQTAAQQGVKNVATDALNDQLQKMGKPDSAAESFEDAVAQTKAAAQPTFKKLDQLSNGEFSTFQNKLKMARQARNRATNMGDMQTAETAMKDAQDGIDNLVKTHAQQFQPNELENAQSAWKDMQTLDKVHSYVEKAFSAPEDIAGASKTVARELDGSKLKSNLNQMMDKIPQADLARVLGANGVQNLYEIAELTKTPETLSKMQAQVTQIATEGAVGKLVKSPFEARNLVARYLATSPRVSGMMINALKFGTPAKIYGPLIANAINQAQQQEKEQ